MAPAKRSKNKKSAPTSRARAGRGGGKRGGTKQSARSKELVRLAKMMAGIDFCMMTTHGDGGAFHTRPMSNNGEVEFDGDSWFFTWKKSCKVDELEDDARVSLSLVGGTKKAPIWIAVAGTAEMIDDVAMKKKLWQKELDRWFDDGPEDPDVLLIKVRAERAQWWSYEEEGEIDLR